MKEARGQAKSLKLKLIGACFGSDVRFQRASQECAGNIHIQSVLKKVSNFILGQSTTQRYDMHIFDLLVHMYKNVYKNGKASLGFLSLKTLTKTETD